MSEEPYEPRKDDHLVEPMFAGLGVGGEEEPEPRRGWWAAVWRFLRRWWTGRRGGA